MKQLIAVALAVILPLSAINAGNSSGITVGQTNPYGGTTGGSYGGGYTLSAMALAALTIIVATAAAVQVKKNASEPQGNDVVAPKPPTAQR